MSGAVEPRTRARQVADELRRRITSGELSAGTRLRQVQIAEMFNVSTTPVREAFTSLAREGLVRQDAHRGVVVFVPTRDDVHANYEIRLALEPLAAEIAAKKISDADLSRLDGLLAAMERPEEASRYAQLNREFHEIIYAAADRTLLFEFIERLRDAAQAYVQLVSATPSPSYYDAVREEHAEIAAALRARAPRRAHKAVSAHLQHNVEQISSLLDD